MLLCVFVERKTIPEFLPGFEKWKSSYNPEPIGLKYIDHMVEISWNEMNVWEDFYLLM